MYGPVTMAIEPALKRAVAFIDGQNLFHAARRAFGHRYPNYDVHSLARRVAEAHGWAMAGVRFYTGVPGKADDAVWHTFWLAKLAAMGRLGVHVFSRPLRYQNRRIVLPDGTDYQYTVGVEKGIDVRLAIDVIRLAHRRAFDVALIFSQDQDLSEVALEIREIARDQGRWIKVASAFPFSAEVGNRRGIDSTDWLRIDRGVYDACLDRRHYNVDSVT
jgi:uncharacterized LabA/DUF88 family protein